MTNDELEREYSAKAAEQSQARAARREQQANRPITSPALLSAHVRRLNTLLGQPKLRRRRNKAQQ